MGANAILCPSPRAGVASARARWRRDIVVTAACAEQIKTKLCMMLGMVLRGEVYHMWVPPPDTDIQDLRAMAVDKFDGASARSPEELLAAILEAHPSPPTTSGRPCTRGPQPSLRKCWRSWCPLVGTLSTKRYPLPRDSPLCVRASGNAFSCPHCPGGVGSAVFGGSPGGASPVSGRLAFPCVWWLAWWDGPWRLELPAMARSPLACSVARLALGRPWAMLARVRGRAGPLARRASGVHACGSLPVGGVAGAPISAKVMPRPPARGSVAPHGMAVGATGVAASGLRARRLPNGGRRLCSAHAWMS